MNTTETLYAAIDLCNNGRLRVDCIDRALYAVAQAEAAEGRVFIRGGFIARNRDYLPPAYVSPVATAPSAHDGFDYEGAILARQSRYMDI